MARRGFNLSADDLDELVPDVINGPEWPLDKFPANIANWAVKYSTALGCKPVVFLLPLLAAVASLIGTRGAVFWGNVVIASPLFVMVAAPSGSRKSAAFRVISRALHGLARTVTTTANAADAREPASPTRGGQAPAQFVFEGGTFAALRHRLEQQPGNRRSMLGLYEEAVSLLSWMGGLAHDQRAFELDLATLLVLFDGHPWSRELVTNGSSNQVGGLDDTSATDPDERDRPATGVSLATWSQPALVLAQLGRPDHVGFWARWELCFTGRLYIENIMNREPFEPSVTVDQLLATVYNAHRTGFRRYTLTDAATTEYNRLFQLVENELDALQGYNEAEARILGKIQGKILKFAMAIHVLRHALDGREDITLLIDEDSVATADAVVRFHAQAQKTAREKYVSYWLRRRAAATNNNNAGNSGNGNTAGGSGGAANPTITRTAAVRAIAPAWRRPAAIARIRGSRIRLRQARQRAHTADNVEAERLLQRLVDYGLLTKEPHSNIWRKAQLSGNPDDLTPNQREALHEMGISLQDFRDGAREGYLEQGGASQGDPDEIRQEAVSAGDVARNDAGAATASSTGAANAAAPNRAGADAGSAHA